MNHYVLRIDQRKGEQRAGTVVWVESGRQEVFHDAEELLAILAITSRYRKKSARSACRQVDCKAGEGRKRSPSTRKRASDPAVQSHADARRQVMNESTRRAGSHPAAR